MKLLYFIILCIVLWTCYHAYIMYTFRFWGRQPVFHYHYLNYWLKPPKIIHSKHFKSSTFLSDSLDYESFQSCSKERKEQISSLIINHFYRTKEGNYNPEPESIFDIWLDDDSMLSSTNLLEDGVLGIGSFISSCGYKMKLDESNYELRYVDYLCTHSELRKSGLTEKLIYSLAYNDFHKRENKIFLFKKEYSLQKYVPFLHYNSSCFTWNPKTIHDLQPKYKIHLVDHSHIHNVYQFVTNNTFQWCIYPSYERLVKMISSTRRKYFIVYNNDDLVIALFGMKYSDVFYKTENTEKQLLENIVYYRNHEFLSYDECYELWKQAVSTLDETFGYVLSESVCDGHELTSMLNKTNDIWFTQDYAYYWYNFAYYTQNEQNGLLMI